MIRRHKPSFKIRTCVCCVSSKVNVQKPKQNTKMNSVSNSKAPMNCEISKAIQRDDPTKSLQKSAPPRRRNRILSVAQENLLCEHILTLSEKDYVFNQLGLRKFVKAYLDELGIRVDGFKDNFPGRSWARAFLKRHNQRLYRYVLHAKTIRNKEKDRLTASRAISTGFQEECVSLLETQPSEGNQTAICDTTGSPSQYSTHSSSSQKAVYPRRKMRNELVKICQEEKCSARIHGDHDYCLTHSLCIQDDKFTPENCPVCSSWMAPLLELNDMDITKTRMHQWLSDRWRRAHERYGKKGKTISWRNPSLAQRLCIRQPKRTRLSVVTELYREKRLKVEIKKEDIEICEAQNKNHGEKSQQEEGIEMGLKKSSGGSQEKKKRMGDLENEVTGGKSTGGQIVNMSQEFPKVVLEQLSLDVLSQYPGSAVKCSSLSDPHSLERCRQKPLPKGTKYSSQKAASKITSKKNASSEVRPKIISKNGLKMTQRRSSKRISLRIDVENGLKDTLYDVSKVKREVNLNNNNDDDAPESIPPENIFGGLSESFPLSIPKWDPESTAEDSLINIRENGSESVNKKFPTYSRGNTPKSSQNIPVAKQKNIPELPSEVTRELQQLRMKVKCLEAKCERLDGVEKERRWLADMCAKKEDKIRHLKEEIKKADSQGSENKKLKRKEASVKLWKEKYKALVKLHASYVKRSIKRTVNSGVQVSQSRKVEARQKMLKSKAVQVCEVKDPLQAAKFPTLQSNSCSPKLTENLQSPKEVAKTEIRLQTPNLQSCQQKPKSQLKKNSWIKQTTISPSKSQVLEKLPVNHLIPESLALRSETDYQISKSHTPKHAQVSHTTHLAPELQTPQLLSVGQVIQSTPTCQTPQTTCTLQTTQLTPVLQTPQITQVSQTSQLMLTSKTSHPTPVPEISHPISVSQALQLSPTSQKLQVTPALPITLVSPTSKTTQVSPTSNSTQLTPTSQTTHITDLQSPHLAPTVQLMQQAPNLPNPRLMPRVQITQQEIESIIIDSIIGDDLLFGTPMESGIQVEQNSLLRQRVTNHSGVMLTYTPPVNRPVLKPVEQTMLQTVHRTVSTKNKLEAMGQSSKAVESRTVYKALATSHEVDPDYEMVIVVP